MTISYDCDAGEITITSDLITDWEANGGTLSLEVRTGNVLSQTIPLDQAAAGAVTLSWGDGLFHFRVVHTLNSVRTTDDRCYYIGCKFKCEALDLLNNQDDCPCQDKDGQNPTYFAFLLYQGLLAGNECGDTTCLRMQKVYDSLQKYLESDGCC